MKLDKPLTVLVTGVGAPGTWGTLHSLRANPTGLEVRAIGSDMSAENAGRYLVDEFYVLPKPSEEGYLGELLDVCSRSHATIVLPQTTAETAFLAAHGDVLAREGVALVAPPGDVIAVANSKAELLQAAKAAGVAVPPTYVCRSSADVSRAADMLGYPHKPFVVKPAVSSGSRGFRVVRPNPTSLEQFLNEKPDSTLTTLEQVLEVLASGNMPDMLASEFLPGPEYSVDIFCSADRFEAVPRKRTSIRTGISNVTDLVDEPDMIEQSERIARAIGLTGVFGFQFKETADGKFRLLECNPRVQGTMVASLLSGFNMVWAGVCHAKGWPIAIPGVETRSGTFYRYWAGLGTTGGRRVLG